MHINVIFMLPNYKQNNMAKKIRKAIEARLEDALADFTRDISDKKFKKHVRKAVKILEDGLELPGSADVESTETKRVG